MRTSSVPIAGDYSGLTATGRPISGQGRRQMTRYVRSMFSQQLGTGTSPSRATYSSGNHGSVLRSQSGYNYGRQSSGGSVSGNSLINIDRPGSSVAVDFDPSLSLGGESGGKFVASFCQSHLGGGEKEKQTRRESEGHGQTNTAAEVTK